MEKKHLYGLIVAACVSYVVPKIIDLLGFATFWLVTHRP